ncbi:MAG TPA: CHASE2 domain-containing protein, partial [Spirochaetes bacterium]|nr:CHASE2 domain-containing protein [Spirochaetota bacterium]
MQKKSSPLLTLIKLFSSLLIPVALSILYFQGKLRIYDNQVSDLIALHLSYKPPSITKDIVYVMLSQEDLNEASKEYKMGWPWKRQAIGKIIRFLQLSEAKVIGLNFFFTEKSVYNTKEISDDQAFCKSLKASDNIVLAFQFLQHEGDMNKTASQEGITDSDPVKAELLPFAVQSNQKSLKTSNYYKAELPISEICSSTSRLGAVNLKPDSDQIFRHLSPLFRYSGHYYPSFGLAVLSRLFNENRVSFKDNAVQFKGRSIPLNSKGLLRLKFYGSNNIYKDYYFMDLMRVYDQLKAIYNKYNKLYPEKNMTLKEVYRNVSALQEMIQKVKAHDPHGFQGFSEELIQSHLPERFKGKIILMGSIASGLINRTPTYYDPKEVGLHLHATFINDFLNNDFLTEIREDLYLAILLVISTGLIAYFTSRHKYSLSISITFITIISILAASVLLYNEGNIAMDTFTPLLISLFTFINTTFVKHFEAHIRLKEYAGEIRYQKEEYQKLIDSANDPILIIQKDKIVFANHKTKELFGYSEEEIPLLSLGDFIHFNGKEGDLRKYISQMDDPMVSSAETRVRSKDG